MLGREGVRPLVFAAIAAAVVGGAATALGSNGDARSASTAPGAIVFAREGAGGYDNFFWMDADGSKRRRLPNSARAHAAVWSPDGRRMAFGMGSFPSVALHVADANGSNRRALTRRFRATSVTPFWSPNGRRIAFELYDDGCHSLYVINADGGGLKRLTKSRGCAYDQEPAWSPDGKRLVFESHQRLVLIDADGRHRRLLTRDRRVLVHTNFEDKSWLPRAILFVNTVFRGGSDDDDREWHLFRVRPDGSGLRDLTPDASQVRRFEVAPDRKTVAYESDGEISLVSVEGSGLRKWASHAERPSWAPNSRRIAFMGARDDGTDIYAMNVDGSRKRNLTRSAADEYCPAWRPASR